MLFQPIVQINFPKLCVSASSDCRLQVAGGPSSYGERVIFDPPHGRFWVRSESFLARDWPMALSLCFSRHPRGDFSRRVEPRTAIVDETAIVFVAAVRTLCGAAEARCRGRGKLGVCSLDAGGRAAGFALTGAGKVLCLDQVCLNARLDTQHLESR